MKSKVLKFLFGGALSIFLTCAFVLPNIALAFTATKTPEPTDLNGISGSDIFTFSCGDPSAVQAQFNFSNTYSGGLEGSGTFTRTWSDLVTEAASGGVDITAPGDYSSSGLNYFYINCWQVGLSGLTQEDVTPFTVIDSGGGSASTTPADLVIYNGDIYPFLFIASIFVFLGSFIVVLKA